MGLPRKPPTTKRSGRHPVNALSPRFVSTVDKAGKYWDGHGLLLVVQPSGSRSWIQRLTIRGRRRELGLGSLSAVSLKRAREQALANLQEARQGRDPLEEKRRSKGIPKFSALAAQVVEQKKAGWRNPRQAKQWQASLEQYVFPHIGERLVSEVTRGDIVKILTPIWNKKEETARRVFLRIGAVLEWARTMEFRPDNPCGGLKKTLPNQNDVVKHMPALPHEEVSAAIIATPESGPTA